jgi:hypothetical protein
LDYDLVNNNLSENFKKFLWLIQALHSEELEKRW